MAVRAFLALSVALAATGCALDPKIEMARLSPPSVAPGQVVAFDYALDWYGGAADLISVEVSGLPANTVAAGTSVQLSAPKRALRGTQEIAIRAPASAGVYPLSLVMTTRNGRVSRQPLGNLTIVDVPGHIDSAQLEPSTISLSACVDGVVPVTLRYTVSDPNGANGVADLKLRPDDTPDPAPPAAAPLQYLPMPNGAMAIVPGPAGPVAIGGGEVPIPPPTHPESVNETVTVAIPVGCNVPTPSYIRWVLSGTDPDPVAAQSRPTNAIPLRLTIGP